MSEPTVGQMITPTLRLERPLGGGGMGSVWIAEHLGLQTQVVVKFMAEELAATEEGKVRFSREAAATARVRSPHVVHTLDYGVTGENIPYLVMELLEGHDLVSEIDRCTSLPPDTVVAIVVQLSRALSRVHESGIVHRDIKPSNIFLCDAAGACNEITGLNEFEKVDCVVDCGSEDAATDGSSEDVADGEAPSDGESGGEG